MTKAQEKQYNKCRERLDDIDNWMEDYAPWNDSWVTTLSKSETVLKLEEIRKEMAETISRAMLEAKEKIEDMIRKI